MGSTLSHCGKNNLSVNDSEIFDQLSDVTEIEYPMNQKELIYNNRK